MNNFKEFRQSFIGKFYESLLGGIDRSKDLIQEVVGVRNRVIRAFVSLKYFVYSFYMGVLGVFVKMGDTIYSHVAYFKDLFVEYGRRAIDMFSFGSSNIADIVWVIYVLIIALAMLTLVYYLVKICVKLITSLRAIVNELNSMKNELLALVNKNVEVKKPIDVLGVNSKNVNGEEIGSRKYSDAEHIAHLRRK